MHFLTVTLNYTPETTAVAPFNTGLCEHLVARGHRVTVITAFPHYPQWRTFDGYRGLLYKRETINGVDVRRVVHYVPSQPKKLIPRLMYFASFPLSALFVLPAVQRFDGIFCVSPSPFVPPIGWLAGRFRNVPTVLEVTDLSFKAALSLDMMQDGTVFARAARFLEGLNYSRMSAISVLCPAFKDALVDMGVPEGKIHVVPTWADTEYIRPLDKDNEFRLAHRQSKSKFIVLYSGNMGEKQGLSTVVEAANMTRGSVDLSYFLIGAGEDYPVLERLIAGYALDNLRLLPLQPAEIYPSVLAAADALLIVQKASVTDVVIPSKMLTYMAAGRPIVASVHPESTTAHYIHEANCGLVVHPEKPSALVEGIAQLQHNPDKAAQLGVNGRIYAERHFSKSAVLSRYDRLFEEVFPGFS